MGLMDQNTGKILIVDDDEDIVTALRLLLKQRKYSVETLNSPDPILSLLQKTPYDAIMLDMNFTQDATSGKEGFHWLEKILQADPNAVVILITAFGDVEMAVQAIKIGAFDFILKPWENEKLLTTLSAGIKLRQSRQEIDRLRMKQQQLIADINQKFPDIIGSSSAMRNIFKIIA